MEDFKGCFDSLARVEVTVKGLYEEMVNSNAYLTNNIATLTDANSRLSKKV